MIPTPKRQKYTCNSLASIVRSLLLLNNAVMDLFRSQFCRFAALLIGVGCAPLVAAQQQESVAPPLRLGESPERDFQLTVHARKVLAETPGLSHLNVGIRVRRGVVSVWGPVPDQEAARKIVARLDTVKGVTGIESELYVGSGGEGIQAFAIPPAGGNVAVVSAAPPAPPIVNPSQEGSPENRITSRVLRMDSGVVAKPAPIPAAKLTAGQDKPKFNPAVQPTPIPADAQIRELVRRQPGFGLIRYQLDGGVLVIQGGSNPSRQMEFAQACSSIPGVSRVRIAPE